ncbi:hypothetical protein PT502_02275 [Aliarcobacter butzleri]|uniref:hypothetical protein n=1 Tax=Aliarcobacter butzleri TaxID=28197 RepID=UPI0024DE8DDE|nr:hypothetical protein [Aliarcobacter butzleri]MDK2082616.1 hypothetical protein [Aliarcobacter butzleri]
MNNKTFDSNWKIKLPILILLILIALMIVFGILLYRNQTDVLWASIFSGVTTGLFISIIQFIISWYEHNKFESMYEQIIRFKQMGIKRILPHRDNEDEYRDRIINTKKTIWIMGNTSSRFIEDFANENSRRSEKKVLFNFLSNPSNEVKILIPTKEYLDINAQKKFDDTLLKMKKIRTRYSNFQVKYFAHQSTHSIFLFDKDCLLGPIFPNIESKDTPTLQVKVDGEYSEEYIKYFLKEWDNAKSIDEL